MSQSQDRYQMTQNNRTRRLLVDARRAHGAWTLCYHEATRCDPAPNQAHPRRLPCGCPSRDLELRLALTLEPKKR